MTVAAVADEFANRLERAIEATARASNRLSHLLAIEAQTYPPQLGMLKTMQRHASTTARQVKRLQLDIDEAEEDGRLDDVATLREQLAPMQSQLAGGSTSGLIMKERTRLARLAKEHFPELLLPGSLWAADADLDADSIYSAAGDSAVGAAMLYHSLCPGCVGMRCRKD